MPITITGNPDASHGNPITLTAPADTDPATAASVNVAFQALSDGVAALQATSLIATGYVSITGAVLSATGIVPTVLHPGTGIYQLSFYGLTQHGILLVTLGAGLSHGGPTSGTIAAAPQYDALSDAFLGKYEVAVHTFGTSGGQLTLALNDASFTYLLAAF